MRKCDVCGTYIPSSTNRCPNCGQRYKTDRKIVQKSTWADYQPKQKNNKIRTIEDKKESKALQKILIIVISSVIILGVLGIGATILISRMVFSQGDSQIEIVSATYDDYDTFSIDFPDESQQIKPYAIFMNDVIEKYHNDDYPINVFEEFIVDDGQLVGACFLADIVYSDYEVTIQLNRNSDGWWEIDLFNSSETVSGPVANVAVLRMFTDILEIDQGALDILSEMFIDEWAGKDYSRDYYLGRGTVNFQYYEGYFRCSIDQPIDLNN